MVNNDRSSGPKLNLTCLCFSLHPPNDTDYFLSKSMHCEIDAGHYHLAYRWTWFNQVLLISIITIDWCIVYYVPNGINDQISMIGLWPSLLHVQYKENVATIIHMLLLELGIIDNYWKNCYTEYLGWIIQDYSCYFFNWSITTSLKI